jgi:hypothetical protein
LSLLCSKDQCFIIWIRSYLNIDDADEKEFANTAQGSRSATDILLMGQAYLLSLMSAAVLLQIANKRRQKHRRRARGYKRNGVGWCERAKSTEERMKTVKHI